MKTNTHIVIIEPKTLWQDIIQKYLEAKQNCDVLLKSNNWQDFFDFATECRFDLAVINPFLNGTKIEDVPDLIKRAAVFGKIVVTAETYNVELERVALTNGALALIPLSRPLNEFLETLSIALSGRISASEKIRHHIKLFRPLTPRLTKILILTAQGKRAKQIAHILGTSSKTVDNQRVELYKRIGVHSIADCVRYAADKGLTSEKLAIAS